MPGDAAARWLITQVQSGNCVLFVGAGLSRACTDDKGRRGPSAAELAEEIGKHFLGQFQGWPLPVTCSYAISLTSRGDIEAFVRERLDGLTPSPGAQLIPRLPWKSIYTTNFDRVIERAYEMSSAPARHLHPVYTDKTRLRDLKPDDIPLYKLHGCTSRIDEVEGSLALTGEDLAKVRPQRKRLFQRLADEMSEYTILYVGYARQDPHFEELLAELIDELGGPKGMPRSFALCPEFEDFERIHWDSRKITLIDKDAEAFLPWLEAQCRELEPVLALKPATLPGIVPDSVSVSQETVESVRRHFEVVREELTKGAPDFADFFHGDRPSWGQIHANCDARREISDEVILELLGHEQHLGPQLLLIRSEAGAGKTTVLRRIAADLTSVWELPVLSLRYNATLEFDILDSIARLVDRRLYICIDDADEHLKEIAEFVTRARRAASAVTLVAAARANEWSERAAQFPLPPITTFDLRYLTEAEIVALLSKLEDFGQLGVLAPLAPEERRAAFRVRAERQLLVALREATEGKAFDQIIRDEYDGIPSQEAKHAYLFICAMYHARVPMRAGVLRRLTGVPFDEFSHRLLRPAERIIIEEADETGTNYRARHRVIARIVADYQLPSAADRLSVYKTILGLLDLGYEDDLLAYRRLSRSRELVQSLGTYDLKTEFYKACREVDPADATVAQHWAIMAMDSARLGLAEEQLAQAQKLAPRDPSIQHTAGMLAFVHYRKQEGGPWERVYFERAQETFERLARRFPTQVAAYDSLARLYQERGDRAESPEERVEWYAKGHEVLLEGLRHTVDKSGLYACEGLLQQRMGEYADAEQAFQAALKVNPGNTAARHLYARFLLQRSRAPDAIDLLEAGLDFDRDDLRLRHSLAVAYAAAGRDPDEVVRQFRLAIQSMPIHWPAAFDLAVFLYLTARERDAGSIFDELKDLDLDLWEKRRLRPYPAFSHKADLQRQGSIVSLRDTFAFVEIPGHPLHVYVDRYRLSPKVEPALKDGARVTFRLGFTLFGPVAVDVEMAN